MVGCRGKDRRRDRQAWNSEPGLTVLTSATVLERDMGAGKHTHRAAGAARGRSRSLFITGEHILVNGGSTN